MSDQTIEDIVRFVFNTPDLARQFLNKLLTVGARFNLPVEAMTDDECIRISHEIYDALKHMENIQ